ncbi:hypothetical protein GGR58DRAFT_496969 [Xylaria digitata]|nr:hypothetical protein GGR58DRAFT_496969 [Xylaria digitata]
MWRKFYNDARSQSGISADVPATPSTLVADEELSEELPSTWLLSENVGLFPIEPAKPLNTPGPAHLEIIAVHGLGGDWEKTWTASNGNMWLRDFLPFQLDDIELNARIWSYGYNSRTVFSAAVSDITDEASILLDRIQGEQISDADKKRRIVFVAHSLGGILAMVLAQERYTTYGDLLSRIYGVVFLGTPHRGSDLAWWATFAANMLKAIQLGRGTNTTYVSGLKRNSEEFAHISQQWVERSANLQIRTFYETERLSGVLVVDKESACLRLPNEVPVGLAGSNHRTLCKFEEAGSQRYRPVINALRGMAAEVRDLILESGAARFTWTSDHTSLVQLLSSGEYESDRARNPTREPGTCEWITRHSQFKAWLDFDASAILWLSGDPGCGKSVASSFLADFLKSSQPSALRTYFFFKYDSERQASAISALRAILHQIFTDRDRASLVEHGMEKYRKRGSVMITQFFSLWYTLVSALCDRTCGNVFLILDALDECKDQERKLLIEALTNLCQDNSSPASKIKLKGILTSRPYAAIQRAFKGFRTIRIRAESNLDSIDDDVRAVIDSRIERFSNNMDVTGDDRVTALKYKLLGKADHTFLWVSLILDMLDQSEDCTFEELHDIIDNPNPSVDTMIATKASSARVGQLEAEEKMRGRMLPSAETGIREVCGLFVRIVQGKVVLVHQTAREFLISKPEYPSRNNTDSLKGSLRPTESNRLLAGICLTYLLSIPVKNTCEYGQIVPGRRSSEEASPDEPSGKIRVLNHAAKHLLNYIRLSGSDVGGDDEIGKLALELFSNRDAYVSWYTLNEDTEARILVPPLIYAVNFDLTHLVKGLLRGGHDPDTVDRNGVPALLRAVKRGSLESARLLLDAKADSGKGDGHTTALHLAVEKEDLEMLELLLCHGADRLGRSLTKTIPLASCPERRNC